jgi:hypothetical protein
MYSSRKLFKSITNVNELLQFLHSSTNSGSGITNHISQNPQQKKEFGHLLMDMQKYKKQTMIEPISERNRVLRMREIFPTMEEERNAFSNPIVILEQFYKTNQYRELDWFYQRILEKSLVTDSIRMILIKSYFKRKNPQKVYFFMRQLDNASLIALRYYTETCIQCNNLGAALFALNSYYYQHNIKVPLHYFERLFHAAVSLKQYKLALKLINKLPNKSSDLLPALVYYGYENDAWRLYDVMVVNSIEIPDKCKIALLHLKVQKGPKEWIPYWKQHRHLNPWMKTLEKMISDCKRENEIQSEMEQVTSMEPVFVRA